MRSLLKWFKNLVAKRNTNIGKIGKGSFVFYFVPKLLNRKYDRKGDWCYLLILKITM